MPRPRGTAEWPEARGQQVNRGGQGDSPGATPGSLGLHWPLTSLQDENWELLPPGAPGHGAEMRGWGFCSPDTLSTGDQPATNRV